MKRRDAIAHLIGMHEDVLAGFHRKCSFISLLPKLRLERGGKPRFLNLLPPVVTAQDRHTLRAIHVPTNIANAPVTGKPSVAMR
jgi:hypothetical protein